mgnify:CR=1 FL=1
MAYFKELPNVVYQSPLINKTSSREYVIIKNIFRNTKLLDHISDKAVLFNKYQIYQGDRPDTIAEEIYGDPGLDWVIILTAGITNIRNQWPLNNQDLYEYALGKYGSSLNDLHHYETTEVRDQHNRLILPKGIQVDDNFIMDGPGKQYRGPNDPQVTWRSIRELETIKLTQDTLGGPAGSGGSGLINDIAIGISNWQYETNINDEKRSIRILKVSYLAQFLDDFRRIMRYDRNSQYISKSLIKTENTRLVD